MIDCDDWSQSLAARMVGSHGALNLKCVRDSLHRFWDRVVPVTLTLKLDLDMVKMHLCTQNEVLSFSSSKFCSLNRTEQTGAQTNFAEIVTFLKQRMILIYIFMKS